MFQSDFYVVCGEVGALRAVLAAGADAATPDQHGGYPLHYAAQMCGAPAATDHQVRYMFYIIIYIVLQFFFILLTHKEE